MRVSMLIPVLTQGPTRPGAVMIEKCSRTMQLTARNIHALKSVATAALVLISLTTTGSAQSTTSSAAGSASHASYEGFAQASSDVELSTDEVGQLIAVPVEIGQTVSPGEVLAQLDDRSQRAAVAVSQAQAAMDGEIRSAEANRSLQAYRVEKLQALRHDEMAGAEELRRAMMELAVAEARLQMAREQKQLRQAELARLDVQVELRKIRAPFAGIIADKYLDAGAAVTPGNAAILRLIRTDQLVGVFNVPAEHSFPMRVGMGVQVYFRAARQTVDGKIEAIAPLINGESGTVMVQIAIANPHNTLRPGDRLSMRITPGQDLETDPSGQASLQATSRR